MKMDIPNSVAAVIIAVSAWGGLLVGVALGLSH